MIMNDLKKLENYIKEDIERDLKEKKEIMFNRIEEVTRKLESFYNEQLYLQFKVDSYKICVELGRIKDGVKNNIITHELYVLERALEEADRSLQRTLACK